MVEAALKMRFKIRLTPQNKEFFRLYERAATNAVETARLLVELLDRFPDDGSELVRRVKDREHEGDRLTHEIVDLLNRTFVTPFDRDDMYRLASALDDICDHVDEAADNIGLFGVKVIPERGQAAGAGDSSLGREARGGGKVARRLQGCARTTG